MRISARNVLKGKVIKLTKGAVNAEVILELPSGERLVSIITNESVDNLGLAEGEGAWAVIKATNIMIAVE
jgi:molybdopterin-binding protein